MSSYGNKDVAGGAEEPRRSSLPEWRVEVSTANYVQAASPEEAARKALDGFLNLLPEHLHGDQAWKVVKVTATAPPGGED